MRVCACMRIRTEDQNVGGQNAQKRQTREEEGAGLLAAFSCREEGVLSSVRVCFSQGAGPCFANGACAALAIPRVSNCVITSARHKRASLLIPPPAADRERSVLASHSIHILNSLRPSRDTIAYFVPDHDACKTRTTGPHAGIGSVPVSSHAQWMRKRSARLQQNCGEK